MGLFSSIGGILGGIGGAILGGPAGAVIGSGLAGAVGGSVDANQANKKAQGYYNQQMSFAQQQAQFQQDYARHVMEWRVEDAKNAGVHPMAALGISNPSYSPVSAPSAPEIYDAGNFDTGSTFGQSLNRASFQAKTMEQQQQAATLGFQQLDLQNQGIELDNQYKALQVAQLASELQRNAASSAPAPKVNNQTPEGLPAPPKSDGTGEALFTFGIDGKGKKTRIYPTDFMTSTWEDRPGGSSLTPLAEAEYLEQDAKLRGTVVNGHIWSPSAGEFVPVTSKAGRLAIAHWSKLRSASGFERARLRANALPKSKLDLRFFDWIDDFFKKK